MNIISPDNSVDWLFLDLNSFFASCEQQYRPELRGRPIAIVQTLTDSTCAIAASYEAKAFGIKTGTAIWEAKQKCPDLMLVKARHQLYVQYHHRILAAIDTCVPVTKICSIDEMACRLMGTERDVTEARTLAHKVKEAIQQQVGQCMTCSIGLAPSLFLGKIGSDMQKPNGLVVITKIDLPEILHRLKLTDIYGIGTRMERRLNMAGIGTVAELMAASRQKLRQAWGGIYGVLYYELLHGADLQFPSSPHSHSISHQHVLEPELRTIEGAKQFSQHLLAKAAERLRHKNYYARRLGLSLSWTGDWGHWWDEVGFHETQSTDFLLPQLLKLWRSAPRLKPVKVGVMVFGLVPAAQHQPDLFANSGTRAQRRLHLSPLIDAINQRFGRGAITFGKPSDHISHFTGHAAFQRVPDEFEF
jgi:DNA polymerase-4